MHERTTARATIHHHAELARIEEMHRQAAARMRLEARRQNEKANRPRRLATAQAWRLALKGESA